MPGEAFSTFPKQAQCKEPKVRVICKGPPDEVCAVECAAYSLAERLNIRTPRWGIADFGGVVLFVCEQQEVPHVQPLLDSNRVTNLELLDQLLVFDMWIANTDRTMANLVGAPDISLNHGHIEILAIDFEKSQVLRAGNIVAITALDPSHMLPHGALLGHLQRNGRVIERTIDNIRTLDEADIRDTLERMRNRSENSTQSNLIPEIPMVDVDTVARSLLARAQQLPELVTQVLNNAG